MASSNNENKVALDTNILFSISQYRVDIFEEIKRLLGKTAFFVSEAVDAELDKLKDKHKKEVSIARLLMEKNLVKKVKTKAKKADNSLIELAEKGYIIATADKELKRKVKGKKGRLIYLRQKKYLEIA